MNYTEEQDHKEYEFLKFYLAIKAIRKECDSVNKVELTRKLVSYYSNPEYSFLFEDLIKKKSVVDMKMYVDLYGGFEIATNYGLLIKEDNDNYIVNNMTHNRIMSELKKHDKEEIQAMYMMISEMRQKEVYEEYKSKIKTPIKK